MLEKMRESSKNGLTMVIFVIIMVVFAISFGAPSDGCQQSNGPKLLATVHGDDVTTREVGIIFNKYSSRNMTDTQLATERSKALRAAIMLRLMAQEATSMGLRVSDEEFKAYMTDPTQNLDYLQVYGTEGDLNGGLYKNYVQNQLRVGLKYYESFKRRELLARKYLQIAEMQVGALPKLVDELDALRHEKINLEYIKISKDMLKEHITIADEEIEAFLKEKAGEVKKEYEDNKATTYTQPEEFKIRRLYISKPGATADDAARKKADDAFALAKKRIIEDKEDFAKVASDLSETAKKEGGLMGWRTKDNLDGNIYKAIESIKDGESKEVITDFAYMIVKLEEKKASVVTPFDDVKNTIVRTKLQATKLDTKLAEIVSQLEAKVKTTKTLEEAIEALKAKDAPAVASKENKTPEEENKTPEGEKRADDAPKSIWDAIKAQETRMFNLDAKVDYGFVNGKIVPKPGSWERIPGIGASKEIALAGFKLTMEKPLGAKVYDLDDSKVFIRLKEREDPKTKKALEAKKNEDKTSDKDNEQKDNEQDDEKDSAKDSEPKKEENPVTKRMKLEQEVQGRALQALAGNWLGVFAYPGEDYGPLLQSLYDKALKSGALKLNKSARIAQLLIAKDIPEATIISTPTKKDAVDNKDAAKKDAAKKDAAKK